MATRSEARRAQSERTGVVKPQKARKLAQRKAAVHHDDARVAKKASYALEVSAKGKRPSRKSTRKSANHIKADTNLVLRSGRATRTPEARARRAQVRRAK
ncbi:hypothetical protein [Labilithrix luteola]|uniref:hypothetical protein n=1 Tax=Labilithrix luteola TaxID=1391654 RepID=UPI0011BABFA6|nr:hypothetical protein [Labilithrix luteola]